MRKTTREVIKQVTYRKLSYIIYLFICLFIYFPIFLLHLMVYKNRGQRMKCKNVKDSTLKQNTNGTKMKIILIQIKLWQ